jgi:hypothetical protein
MHNDFREEILAPQERSPPEQDRPSDPPGELDALFTLLYAGTIPPPQDEALLREGCPLPLAARRELAEVLWRVQVAREQIKPDGAVRFTPLRPTVCGPGQCDLCGDPLDPERGYRFRCARCATSLQLALGYLTLAAWLSPGRDWPPGDDSGPGADHDESSPDSEPTLFPSTIVGGGHSPGTTEPDERPVFTQKETHMQFDNPAATAPPVNDGERAADTTASPQETTTPQAGEKTKARQRPGVEITLQLQPVEEQRYKVRAVVCVNNTPLRLLTLQYEQLEPLLLQAREASVEQILEWLYHCVEQWQQESAAWRPARPVSATATTQASQASARVRPGQPQEKRQTPGTQATDNHGQASQPAPQVAAPTETKEQVGAKAAPPQQMPLF